MEEDEEAFVFPGFDEDEESSSSSSAANADTVSSSCKESAAGILSDGILEAARDGGRNIARSTHELYLRGGVVALSSLTLDFPAAVAQLRLRPEEEEEEGGGGGGGGG